MILKFNNFFGYMKNTNLKLYNNSKPMNRPIFLALGLVLLILASGCVQTGHVVNSPDPDTIQKQCPASCDDGNECTADLCDEKSNFECRNVPRWGAACGANGECVNGECIEKTDNCSLEEGDGLDSCYSSLYIEPAIKSRSTAICDEISDFAYMGRCYGAVAFRTGNIEVCSELDEQKASDQCYFSYAEQKAEFFDFDEAACDGITDSVLKLQCLAFRGKVTEPVGFKYFDVWLSGNTINSYFVLKDRKGRTTVSAGTLKIFITQENDKGEETKKLYSAEITVTPEDFKETNLIGVGTEKAYILKPITADDLIEYPTENNGNFYLTFTSDSGTSLNNYHAVRF